MEPFIAPAPVVAAPVPATAVTPIESLEARVERARTDELRRAHELREEARALLQQTLEEALAPLHFAVRDLERRLVMLEEQPRPAPAAQPAAPPLAVARPQALPPAAASPPLPGGRAGSTPALAPSVSRVVAPPAARAPSLDFGVVPFDGARRRRRVVGLFVLFLVLVFGALLATLVSSWLEPR